ncbi:MAG: hypothetical protein VW010_04160, partial [Flavobacteriaceae bacterium]
MASIRLPLTSIVGWLGIFILNPLTAIGKSQSKSTGDWKTYESGEYWFERTDWVHGGDTDTPDLGDVCTELL